MIGNQRGTPLHNYFAIWLFEMATWYQALASQSRQTAAHVWQPRNTSSVIFSKGLLNAPGENNCFLNSAVQVLWHLDVFRRSFREMGGHACMGKACIFCALKVLFTQLRYSDRQSLPPDALRRALAVAFKDELRFQLGCMDDAAECFENILTRIHFHLAHDIKEELCDAKHCIPHRKFAMTLIEHSVCSCGATSEPFPFTQMVHYVSCTALCAEAKKIQQKYKWSNSVCFGQVLRNAGAMGDIRACPSECGKKINIRRVLMNSPDVVSIGLVWDSDRPEKEHIVDVIQCLGTSLRMPDLFNSVVDDNAKQAALHLVGVVTYYGKHYSTFFYNTALRLWVYFDDATVKQVGPNWRDVVNRCKKGHSQPLLLLFANPNGTPVSTETAPQESTLLPGYTDIHSPAAVHCSGNSLHPVFEYEPDNENQEKSKRNEHVVEIGHDALRTIHAKQDGGQYTGHGSQTQVFHPGNMQEVKEYSSRSSGHAKHEFSHPSPANPIVNKQSINSSYNTASKNTRKLSQEEGNIALSRSKGLPISHLGPSHPKDKQTNIENEAYISSKLCQRYTQNAGHVMQPRKLERHESWSGRPSQQTGYVPKVAQSRQSSAINLHNSLSQRPMPNSHMYSSVPDLQQGYGQPSYPSRQIPPHKLQRCQSAFEYSSNNQSMHNLKEGNKSLSVQNIPMATEGILASAIKNQGKQKRASSADNHSLHSSGSRQSVASSTSLQTTLTMQNRQVHGSIGVYCDNPQVSLSTLLDKRKSEHTTQTNGDMKTKDLEASTSYDLFSRRPVSMEYEQDKMTYIHRKNIQSNSFDITGTQQTESSQQYFQKCSPFKSSYNLRDGDSVASRDSGYRSRDRSSASSGSVHSLEVSATGAPHKSDSEEKLRELSVWEKAQNPTLHHYKTLACESKTQDMNSACEKLISEIADLRNQSKKMEDDGDLATALALCTSVVAQLKDRQNFTGISPPIRQLLHKEYNNAVLQSRNLHRRLTLLRRQDSIPAYHNMSPNDKDLTSRCRITKASPQARDVNLIDLHDTTHRVDKLKQQLQELYMHKPHPRGTQEYLAEMYLTNNKSLAPAVQESGIARTNSVIAYDEKTCIQTQILNNKSTERNRNQNACNDSCMAIDSQPKTDDRLMMKPSYQAGGTKNTQTNNMTDGCSQWRTQHGCDTVKNPSQRCTAHMSNY